MEVNESPVEGWSLYLAEQQKLLDQEVPEVVIPSLDLGELPNWEITAEDYLDHLVATAPSTQNYLQIQADWDRFVTFGMQPTVEWCLPSPSSRSLTPSPIIASMPPPLPLGGEPMVRHTSGSPDVLDVVFESFPPASPPTRERMDRPMIRERQRRRLRNRPLHLTCHGREVLRLAGQPWYQAPNGFAMMQYPPTESEWRVSEVANAINWLQRGIRVHRSPVCKLLCVENIEALNTLLVEEGMQPIQVTQPPAGFMTRLLREGQGSRQRSVPYFLKPEYLTGAYRRHAERARPHPPL